MRFHHVPRLLKLAGPMILTTSAIMLMQMIDTVVLARHSGEAVAAIGPAGLAIVLFQGFLFGTAGYAGTFVAHNHGRGDAHGVRSSAWLGIYTAVAAGIVALLAAWPLSRLFQLAGHSPQVASNESTYFLICMACSFFHVLSAALAGWLSGIGRPVIVTGVTFVAIAVNALLAWGLVLGEWGLPRLGMAGAALATVIAQFTAATLYASLFARAGGFAGHAAWSLDPAELRRFLKLAMPLGLRISGELVAWTMFLMVVGRLGTVELAASSIAFRLSGMAFFPAMGLGQGAGILVGHARGAGDDDEVAAIAGQSLLVCEIWMLLMALVFALGSAPLISLFTGEAAQGAQIVATGTFLMKFVAFNSLFDAANIVTGHVLAAAGDTPWLARTYLVCSGSFIFLLWLVAGMKLGLAAEWSLTTLFIVARAAIWLMRFRSGAWRRVRVLREPVPVKL